MNKVTVTDKFKLNCEFKIKKKDKKNKYTIVVIYLIIVSIT